MSVSSAAAREGDAARLSTSLGFITGATLHLTDAKYHRRLIKLLDLSMEVYNHGIGIKYNGCDIIHTHTHAHLMR